LPKNEFKKNEIELSQNYIDNTDNNDNKNNYIINNNLKFLSFIIILLLILVIIIILIICSKEDNNENYNQYTFESVYYSDKDNEIIALIHPSFVDSIYKIEINNEEINPCSEYLFKNKGNHTVYFYIKKMG